MSFRRKKLMAAVEQDLIKGSRLHPPFRKIGKKSDAANDLSHKLERSQPKLFCIPTYTK
jgi:hypothetical protein